MKKLFKKSVISGGIMTLGLAVGFATSTAMQDLDSIKENFNILLSINSNNDATIHTLDQTLDDLNAEITRLEQNQNNSGKQERIDELTAQVTELTAERDGLVAGNSELEMKITELKNYTDNAISEVAE